MKFCTLLIFLPLSVLGVSSTASLAQQTTPPAPQRDPQAIVFLHKAMAAMGGSSAAQIQDTVVQALALAPGQDEAGAPTAVIKTKGADKIRWEGTNSSSGTVTIQNGGRLLELKDGRTVSRPSSNAMHRRIEHVPILFLLQEMARGDVSIAYLGQESVGGQTAHRLRFSRHSSRGSKELDEKLTKDSELDLFLDAQSLLPLKISHTYFSETDWRRGLPMEVFYADYRPVDGLLIPFQQRTVFNGKTAYELRMKTFSANNGLADSEFEGK